MKLITYFENPPRKELRMALGAFPNTLVGQKIRFVFGSTSLSTESPSEMSILKDEILRSIFNGTNYMGWDY